MVFFSHLWVTASLKQAYAKTALCNYLFITSQYCLIYLSLGVTLTLCGVFSELHKLKDHYFRATFIMCVIITEEAVFSGILENRFVIVEYIDFFYFPMNFHKPFTKSGMVLLVGNR